MGLFGGSSSKAASTTVTTNQDNRAVGDQQAQVATAGGITLKDRAVNQPISIAGGGKKSTTVANINITNTDHGAISGALGLASQVSNSLIEFVSDASAESNATAKDALGVAEGTLDKTITTLEKAYQDAKGGTEMFRDLSIVAMAVVAFAFWTLKRGKA